MDMDPVFATTFFAAASVIASLTERGAVDLERPTLGLSNQRLMSIPQIEDLFRSFRQEYREGEECERWADEHGIRFLGEGANRAVFQIPNGALKLAKHLNGGTSNFYEATIWEESPGWMKKLLVPVISHAVRDTDFLGRGAMGWVLMDQAYPWDWSSRIKVASENRIELRRDLDRQRRHLQKRLGPFGIEDIRKANMSLDGRLMDYGLVNLPTFQRAVREDSRSAP